MSKIIDAILYARDLPPPSFCPKCGADVYRNEAYVDIRSMPNPPRQTERYRHLVKWQCSLVENHQGRYSEPADEVLRLAKERGL